MTSSDTVCMGEHLTMPRYVPDPYTANTVSQLPAEVTVSAELGPSRQLDRAGRSYQDQEEVSQ